VEQVLIVKVRARRFALDELIELAAQLARELARTRRRRNDRRIFDRGLARSHVVPPGREPRTEQRDEHERHQRARDDDPARAAYRSSRHA